MEKYIRTLTKEEINQLPLKRYKGPINLVRSKKKMKSAIEQLRKESILGFDTETKPSFKKGVTNTPALLQLAGSETVYLFQLTSMSFPKELKLLLSDPDIIKTGVAVRDDIKGLKEISEFEEAGFIDLSEVSRQSGIPTTGLRTMAANFFGIRISKSAQSSNWGRKELKPAQIVYAATDAWMSRKLHLFFQELGLV